MLFLGSFVDLNFEWTLEKQFDEDYDGGSGKPERVFFFFFRSKVDTFDNFTAQIETCKLTKVIK